MLSDQNINPILNSIEANPVTKEMMSIHGNVGNLGEMEEALLLAAAFLQDGKTRIVVKKNKYEAQQLYRRLAMLLQEVVLFVMDESLRSAGDRSVSRREGRPAVRSRADASGLSKNHHYQYRCLHPLSAGCELL